MLHGQNNQLASSYISEYTRQMSFFFYKADYNNAFYLMNNKKKNYEKERRRILMNQWHRCNSSEMKRLMHFKWSTKHFNTCPVKFVKALNVM